MTGEAGTLVALAALALATAGFLGLRGRAARRRRAVTAWLAGGAEVFAGAAASRWAPSGALKARVEQAAPPFLALSLDVGLDPAGLPRLPLPGALGRRLLARDRLVVRSDLTRAPRAEFDLFYAAGAAGRDGQAAAAARRWRVSEVREAARGGLGPLLLAEPAGAGVAPREGLLGIARRMEELSAEIRRVAVRREAPHLLAEVEAPGATSEVTAQALFDLLREAAYLGLGPAGVRRGTPSPS